jgi:putative flippase GtrA
MNIVILSLELAGLPPVVSAGVSYCVSTVFNYVASMRYVFAHREGLSRTREFIIFVTLSVIGLGLNEAIMWLGGRLAGDEWYMLTKVVATALVMFWNFFSRKRWLDAG